MLYNPEVSTPCHSSFPTILLVSILRKMNTFPVSIIQVEL